MNDAQSKVREFHKAFGIRIEETPTLADEATRALRINLIQEELDELKTAFSTGNLVDAADALADLLYVTYGAAVSLGIDMEPVFAEVHRSNMTKIGGRKREDGKWIKPAHYSPADIKSALDAQM